MSKDADAALVERIENCLRQPVYFRDILDALNAKGCATGPIALFCARGAKFACSTPWSAMISGVTRCLNSDRSRVPLAA